MEFVRAAVLTCGIVDVSAVAEKVRLKHAHENVAREDIEALVVQCGGALSAPMEISTFNDPSLNPVRSRIADQLVH